MKMVQLRHITFVTLISFEIDVIHKIKDVQLFAYFINKRKNYRISVRSKSTYILNFFRKTELYFMIF